MRLQTDCTLHVYVLQAGNATDLAAVHARPCLRWISGACERGIRSTLLWCALRACGKVPLLGCCRISGCTAALGHSSCQTSRSLSGGALTSGMAQATSRSVEHLSELTKCAHSMLTFCVSGSRQLPCTAGHACCYPQFEQCEY